MYLAYRVQRGKYKYFIQTSVGIIESYTPFTYKVWNFISTSLVWRKSVVSVLWDHFGLCCFFRLFVHFFPKSSKTINYSSGRIKAQKLSSETSLEMFIPPKLLGHILLVILQPYARKHSTEALRNLIDLYHNVIYLRGLTYNILHTVSPKELKKYTEELLPKIDRN